MLCDLPGEDFREAKDSCEACRGLSIIRRADWFVLLIDGEKIAEPSSRQRAKLEPATLLRTCLDCGMLDKNSRVQVLFSKWDIIEAQQERTELISFVNAVEDEFKRRHASRLGSLQFARVAAHPAADSSLDLGYGLQELLQCWAGQAMETDRQTSGLLVELPTASEFDRYYRRRLPHVFQQR
jgi:hypothetical protein